jgi:aspartate-semialdehyde dehydrogenase
VNRPPPVPAILGASGLIGQHFARLLADHPWMALPVLVGSPRTEGRTLGELWRLPVPVPPELATTRLVSATPRRLAADGIDVVFGALPSGTAGPTESELVRRGVSVFTNSADHRWDPNGALLVPEVNGGLLRTRSPRSSRGGLLVANPNCTATGLALALAPVWTLLRPRSVHVATYQALSGAGTPGPGAIAMADNVVPYIEGEEEKVAAETRRLLRATGPRTAPFLVQAARVPVSDGHLEAVTVDARSRPSLAALRDAWRRFAPLAEDHLPTAPDRPVLLRGEPDRPQPSLDRWAGEPLRARGMAVTVGRLRWEAPYLRFFVLSHNAVRGGAGGSVLNAELALRLALIPGGPTS